MAKRFAVDSPSGSLRRRRGWALHPFGASNGRTGRPQPTPAPGPLVMVAIRGAPVNDTIGVEWSVSNHQASLCGDLPIVDYGLRMKPPLIVCRQVSPRVV
jgi:hypothetical protein